MASTQTAPQRGRPAIASDEAMRIARQDAEGVYGDLSAYQNYPNVPNKTVGTLIITICRTYLRRAAARITSLTERRDKFFPSAMNSR